MKNETAMRRFFNFVAFISVCILAAVLLLAMIFQGSGGTLREIANILAYVVVCFYSFFYAARKWNSGRKFWWVWMLGWAVAVVLVVLYLILVPITGAISFD